MTPTPSCLRRGLIAGCCLLVGAFPGHSLAATVTLSDNLAAPTAFTEIAQGQTWVAAPFRTGTAGVSLTSIDLLLTVPQAGTAVVILYSGTSQPQNLVSALTTLQSSTISSLFQATFYGNGLPLAANTKYWAVLATLGGRFDWAYTDSLTGSGAGFTPGWGVTSNGGATWFTESVSPMQMRVQAVEAAAVPEPGSFALLTCGAGLLGLGRCRRGMVAVWARAAAACAAVVFVLPLSVAAQQAPVSVLSPMPGAEVQTHSVEVAVRVDSALVSTPLKVRLNDKDVSAAFVRSGHCRPDGCPYTAMLVPSDGLKNGKNTLWAEMAIPGARVIPWHSSFDWSPGGLRAESGGYLSSAIGFTTVTPGGGGANGWVQIYNNAGLGARTTYPTGSPCTTQYQVLALNRQTLALTSYRCYDTDQALTSALAAFGSGDLVIAGTTYGRSALSNLDTRPIGGTNYSDPQFPSANFPLGYMIVGVGGAGAGQAYENASTAETLSLFGNGSDTWARANGLLTVDAYGNYSFHPSDYVEFKVRPIDAARQVASITVGPDTYTPPAGNNGFWVILLDRRNLFSHPGCSQSPADTHLYQNCGTFYPTGDSNIVTSLQALSGLTNKLNTVGQSELVFVSAVGIPLPPFGTITSADFFNAFSGLGGSEYILGLPSNDHQSTYYGYTLISSRDGGFSPAITGSAVISTNVGEGGYYLGQTGFVKGVMGRDHNGLFRPLTASQETSGTIDGPGAADFSAYPLFWTQPVAWPYTDTAGRVAAYKWLSYQVVTAHLAGASGNHLDDLRYYYSGSQNKTFANGTVQPTKDENTAKLPGGVQTYVWNDPVDNQSYTISEADRALVAGQLELELRYLTQLIPYFDTVRTSLFDDSSGMDAAMFGAMSTVATSLALPDSTSASLDASKWLKLAGSIVSLGGPVNPAFGVVGGILNVASAVTAFGSNTPAYNANVIPHAFATYETTLSQLESHKAEYFQALRSGFATILDNTYSDWGKLQAAGQKVSDTSSPWYFANQIELTKLTDPATQGALRYYYLQLLPMSYQLDYWPADAEQSPAGVRSDNYPYVPDQPSIPTCDSYYSKNPLPGWSWVAFRSPSELGKSDIFVIGGNISKNHTSSVSERYPSSDLLSTLFSPQGSLKLPRELFFSVNGPLQRRSGPMYSNDRCYK